MAKKYQLNTRPDLEKIIYPKPNADRKIFPNIQQDKKEEDRNDTITKRRTSTKSNIHQLIFS